jgi:hypothetical protein
MSLGGSGIGSGQWSETASMLLGFLAFRHSFDQLFAWTVGVQTVKRMSSIGLASSQITCCECSCCGLGPVARQLIVQPQQSYGSEGLCSLAGSLPRAAVTWCELPAPGVGGHDHPLICVVSSVWGLHP